MRIRRGRVALGAGALAAAMVLSACSSGDDAASEGDGSGGQTEEAADGGEAAGSDAIQLEIGANAVRGGKNEQVAVWIEDYIIPTCTEEFAANGKTVEIAFNGRGIDDEDFKSQLALDVSSGAGPDLMNIDGIWVGEFAEAGYTAPLSELAPDSASWDGWDQIAPAVQANMSYQGERYGVPSGTDGRVLYYNKALFEEAGLPADWQPTSWEEVLEAGRTLQQALPDVTPIQINAGVAMGEATTMQGYLPLLAGAGARVYDEGNSTWNGDTQATRDVLGFYQSLFTEGLSNPDLQLLQDGRDRSFQEFAEGQIGILGEGDYFWRAVIEPTVGNFPMADRNDVVGYAKIPAKEPGAGLNGQDFVSMSGGGGYVLNPNSANPAEAWELLACMNSKDATLALVGDVARITQRNDVNAEILAEDPMLSFVATEVLPLTAYRPGFAIYPQVSVAMQEASEAIVNGGSAADASASFGAAVTDLAGADAVTNN